MKNTAVVITLLTLTQSVLAAVAELSNLAITAKDTKTSKLTITGTATKAGTLSLEYYDAAYWKFDSGIDGTEANIGHFGDKTFKVGAFSIDVEPENPLGPSSVGVLQFHDDSVPNSNVPYLYYNTWPGNGPLALTANVQADGKVKLVYTPPAAFASYQIILTKDDGSGWPVSEWVNGKFTSLYWTVGTFVTSTEITYTIPTSARALLAGQPVHFLVRGYTSDNLHSSYFPSQRITVTA